MWRGVSAAAFAALILATGCTGDDSLDPVEPFFDVGFTETGEFFPIADGGDCPMINGAQGGYWVMPLMRAEGLGETPVVGCTMTDLDTDIVLGDTYGARRFTLDEESGYPEVVFLLFMEAITTGEQFLAVDGHTATFSCSASDGMSVELTREATVTIRSIQ